MLTSEQFLNHQWRKKLLSQMIKSTWPSKRTRALFLNSFGVILKLHRIDAKIKERSTWNRKQEEIKIINNFSNSHAPISQHHVSNEGLVNFRPVNESRLDNQNKLDGFLKLKREQLILLIRMLQIQNTETIYQYNSPIFENSARVQELVFPLQHSLWRGNHCDLKKTLKNIYTGQTFIIISVLSVFKKIVIFKLVYAFEKYEVN